jgi:GNAT superfamily N-acetyltransferase
MSERQPHRQPRASRVEVRPVTDADRSRFVELFGDENFMTFSDGVLSLDEAHERFDRMIARCADRGYRLVPGARGKGYATEASRALLARAAIDYHGDVLAIIHTDNQRSENVRRKLGFRYWKTVEINGEKRNIYRIRL